MAEFQASKVYLQLVFQQTYLQALLASLGVATDKIQTFSWGGGGGGGGGRGRLGRRRKNACGQPAASKNWSEEKIF